MEEASKDIEDAIVEASHSDPTVSESLSSAIQLFQARQKSS